jgi:hypothetical protein
MSPRSVVHCGERIPRKVSAAVNGPNDQTELLAKIKNSRQRQELEAAIASGEPIPDYAWEPIPENWFERVDLSFRPGTYWPEESALEKIVSRIKGEQRRQWAQALLSDGRIEELRARIDDGTFAEDLSDENLKKWSRIRPENLGGEYLPASGPDEVEIGRLVFGNATADVDSIRARQTAEGIVVCVVDEYGTEFEDGQRIYMRPLTLGELIEFIESARHPDLDEGSDGLVLGLVGNMFTAGNEDTASLTQYVYVSSAFYPDIQRYYVKKIGELIPKTCTGWRVRRPGLRRNTANSYRESTPSEKRAGARPNPRAGRDAVRVGLGMNSGKQPYGDASRRPGHTPLRNATPAQRASFDDPVQREAARTRGAGAIAALSPSSPAGMDWENNPTAAHEVGSLTTAHVAKLQGTVDAADGRSKARDALRAAKDRGVGVPEAQAVVDKAEAASRDASAKARASVLGTTGNRTFTSLHHAGDQAIIRAHQVLSGEKTPEQVLPIEAKTGHFYEAIAGETVR